MSESAQENKITNSGEISLADLISKIKSALGYIKSKWIIILLFSIIGALLGLSYAIVKKPTYTAVCTFVLEDAKSSGGMGQYATLASLAGINIANGNGGGIFEGDNIIELYKSRTMIEKALLSSCSFDGKNQLLIERYIQKNKLRETWKKENISNINFEGNPDQFNRKQDSIITSIVELFNNKLLSVTKPDKKLSIISVQVETKDELFSKYFNEKLVQNVNDFYVQTKTKKSSQNLKLLQHQADSVKAILNSSIYGVASAIDAAPNANPQMSTLRASSQRKQIDVQTNSAIYGEVVKNLEVTRMSLRQDVPLIQVIDKPVLPLRVSKTGKIMGVIIGFLLSLFLTVGILVCKKIISKL